MRCYETRSKLQKRVKVFVSKSFDLADRPINSYFERVMAAGIDIATAEDFTGESISQRVE